VLVDFNVDQVELWDTTDKLAPVLLGTATNPGNRYIHSGWPNAAGTHVFFHDELEEIQLGLPTRIYTLSIASLRAPSVAVSYTGPTMTTDHNGYTRGNYYYVSHYRRGVVVFDASNPDNLVEVAHFDNYLTPASNGAGTDGTWGVYPFLPSGNILVSDIENGLFILRDHARTFGQSAGRIGFALASVSHGENLGAINLRVQRVVGNVGTVTVQYATSNGTADSGDYTGSNGTLSWSANDIADKVIAIPVIDDGTVEGAETLNVTLASPTGGATIDGSSMLTITIADNDTASQGGGGGGGGSTDPALLLLAALTLLARRRRRQQDE
jgi:MYXO-CTERM domain-containing protein